MTTSYYSEQISVVPTPEQITRLVDNHETYTSDLRDRMERDWELLTLREFDAGDGYQSYTSNEPMTYYSKVVALLASAQLKVRIPVEKARREKRERESAKERYLVGILRANDERLLRLGQPPLLDTLAGFISLRGWYFGRVLLVKDQRTGETHPDITPWDPLQVAWGMGANGLKWICHKSRKTNAEVAEEYPDVFPELVSTNGYFDNFTIDNSDGLDVYDWWDQVNNIIVIAGKYAKLPTPHGATRMGAPTVPAFFGAVGPLPLIQSRSLMGNQNLVHQGESIFAANRNIYEKVNLVLSTMLQLVALSRNQAYILYSQDGTKTLKQNPSLEGSQVPLVSGVDKLEIMPLLEMSKDTGAFLGLLSAEVQRGALPYSVYGQLAFQLSGYAVNLLKQATDAPITPRKQAVENAYQQIGNLVAEQFASGAFGNMQLQGFHMRQTWFDEEFGPEMIVGLPSAEIKLMVKTPQDDLQKMQLAKMADDGLWPMYPRRVIWDEILDQQDTDSIADAIKEQVGERMLPTASIWTIMAALEKQGRPELAALYFGELVKLGILGMPPPDGVVSPNGSQNGGTPGFSPEVAPGPMQGAPNPQPTPQQGANVPPGSPRPGA